MLTSISSEPRGGLIRLFRGFKYSDPRALDNFCGQICAIEGVAQAVAFKGEIWVEVQYPAAWSKIDPALLGQIFAGKFAELRLAN